jgi:hypothetical protein
MEKDLKKVLFKYFDMYFDDSEFKTQDNWIGFYLDNELILGKPENDVDRTWFYSGPVFENAEQYFSITLEEFRDSMKEYIETNYNLKIKSLW